MTQTQILSTPLRPSIAFGVILLTLTIIAVLIWAAYDKD